MSGSKCNIRKLKQCRTQPLVKSRILFTKTASTIDSSKSCSPQTRFRANDLNTVSKTGGEDSPDLHSTVAIILENFLLQLDELFNVFRRKERSAEIIPQMNGYQDVCEKLRLEILIALDKLELLLLNNKKCTEQQMDFFDKMADLKKQLTNIRWQYHKAIRDLESTEVE